MNLNVYRIQCCFKKQLKFFANLLKRKLLINTPQRFCQNFNKSLHWYFEFCQCLLTLQIFENNNLANYTLSNSRFVLQVICNNVISDWLEFPSEKKKTQNARCANWKHESYVDYHITKVEFPQNVSNPSKQSLKRIFVFKYLETCLSIKRITKQFTIKERLTVGRNLELDEAL